EGEPRSLHRSEALAAAIISRPPCFLTGLIENYFRLNLLRARVHSVLDQIEREDVTGGYFWKP
ncbi:MAG: hypothetical protein B7Z63_03920, partial [Ignavibacteriae bacterium 37-53-5]